MMTIKPWQVFVFLTVAIALSCALLVTSRHESKRASGNHDRRAMVIALQKEADIAARRAREAYESLYGSGGGLARR
jgi:hypothetical protein